MLALQIPRIGQLELVSLPKPAVAPKSFLMRVAACGICGTDPHILHGMYPATLPLVPGHEYAGVVEAVGDGVSDFKPGDRIAVDPNILCGTCSFSAMMHRANLVRQASHFPAATAPRWSFSMPRSLRPEHIRSWMH